MTAKDLLELTQDDSKTKAEKLLQLKKIRCSILEECHCKQQLLDQVDYLIYQLKQQLEEEVLQQ